MRKILVVEDDPSISELLQMNLRLVGYACRQAFDSGEAVRLAREFVPDLILLDVMIPGQEGFTLLKEKAFGEIPVILVTARSETMDRVKGLQLGADDYISKPFETIELLARVEALFRRLAPEKEVFSLGDTVVYLEERRAAVGGEPVELKKREFELLEVLIRNRNIALTRDKLLDLAWGYDYFGDTRTVDVHINKLRTKLKLEKAIKTIYRVGYRLEVER